MANSKQGMTVEQHEEFGEFLHETLKTLQTYQVNVLSPGYPVKSPILKESNRALLHLNELRSALDEALAREHPDRPAQVNCSTYYRATRNQSND